ARPQGFPSNAVIARIGDIQIIAGLIQRNPFWEEQTCFSCLIAITRIPERPNAGNGRYHARSHIYFSNAVIETIRYIQITDGIESNTAGKVQVCNGGGAAVAAKRRIKTAGDRVDLPIER